MDDKGYLCAFKNSKLQFYLRCMLAQTQDTADMHEYLHISYGWGILKKALDEFKHQIGKDKDHLKKSRSILLPSHRFLSPLASLYILQRVGSWTKQVYLVYCQKLYFWGLLFCHNTVFDYQLWLHILYS